MLPDTPLQVVRDAGVESYRGVGHDVDGVRSHVACVNRGKKYLLLIEARFLAMLGMTLRGFGFDRGEIPPLSLTTRRSE